jgi:hypothetical protein
MEHFYPVQEISCLSGCFDELRINTPKNNVQTTENIYTPPSNIFSDKNFSFLDNHNNLNIEYIEQSSMW